MSDSVLRYVATILAATVLAGCAGDGEGLDGNGRPLGEGPGGGPLTADFTSIQDNVFTPVCTACHAGAGAPQGLRLDAANSYDLLVGVPSNEVPTLLRVKPGDPDHSYLIQKLEGHAAVGARMPLGGPYLEAATVAVIRQWITDGAQRSPAAASKPRFDIAMRSPEPGDTLTEAPIRIVVGMTHELDRTRVDATAARLEQHVDTGGAPSVRSVAAQVTVSDANPRALVVTPLEPLGPGQYVLRLRGDALTDLSGATLGDAPAGDHALTQFAIGEQP